MAEGGLGTWDDAALGAAFGNSIRQNSGIDAGKRCAEAAVEPCVEFGHRYWTDAMVNRGTGLHTGVEAVDGGGGLLANDHVYELCAPFATERNPGGHVSAGGDISIWCVVSDSGNVYAVPGLYQDF